MPHIDYYFSVLSPFTYLAGTRLEHAVVKHDATITYKPLDIGALFSRTGGTSPAERHESRKALRLQEMRRQAHKLGMKLKLQPPHWPTNPAPASYAIIAAQAKGDGNIGAFVHAITRSCWADKRDIADDEVIKDCLVECGFDPKLADSGLLEGAETYGKNLEDAVAAGVFGAPFYITDTDERFWGQDRIEDLDAYLAGAL